MSSIDDRIVNMQFNNSQFEKGIKESLGSLKNLDDSLNSIDNGSFGSTLSTNLGSLGKSFSALETIATGALLNIGAKIETVGEQLVASLSVDQVSAGWSKYEEKVQSVATLTAAGLDTDAINESLAKLSWFSDATSYSFTDMTSALSKFVAAGIDTDVAVDALRGLSLQLSMAGISASETGNAYLYATKVMSSGYMSLINWKSFEGQNFVTAQYKELLLETAVAMGTLTETTEGYYTTLEGNEFSASEFSTYLADKWLTSDVYAEALGRYSSALETVQTYAEEHGLSASEAIEEIERLGIEIDEFGLKALKSGQETKSFQEAIDAAKDATSTAWSSIFENLIGDYDSVRRLMGEVEGFLTDLFASPIQELAEEFKLFGGIGLENGEKGLNGVRVIQDTLINAMNSLSEAIDKVKEAFKSFFPDDFVLDAFELNKIFQNVKDATEEGGSFYNAVDGVGTLLASIINFIGTISSSVRELMSGPLASVTDVLQHTFLAVLDNVSASLDDAADWVDKLFSSFEQPVGLTSFIEGLGDLIDILFEVGDAVWTVLSAIFGGGGIEDAASNGVGAIDDIFGWMGEKLKSFKTYLDENDTINEITQVIVNAVEKVKSTVGPVIQEVFSWISGFFDEYGDDILAFLGKAWGFCEEIYNAIVDVAEQYGPVVKEFFVGVWQSLVESFNNVAPKVQEVFDTIGGWFSEEFQTDEGTVTFLSFFAGIIESITPFIQKIGELVSEFLPSLSLITEDGIELIGGFIEKIVQLVEEISNHEKIDLQNVLEIAGVIGAAIFIIKAWQSLFGVSKKRTNVSASPFATLETIKDSLKAISGIFTQISTMVSTFAKMEAAKAMMESLRSIFAMMTLMTQMEWEDVMKGVIAAVAVLGMMTLLMEKLGDFGKNASKVTEKGKDLTTITEKSHTGDMFGLAAIFAAMALVINEIRYFEGVSWNAVGQSITLMAVMMGLIGALLAEVQALDKKYDGKTPEKTLYAIAVTFVALGVAMKKIGDAIAEMDGVSAEALSAAMFIIGELAVMAGLVEVLSTEHSQKSLYASGVMFIALGVALNQCAKAMAKIEEIYAENPDTNAIVVVMLLIVELSTLADIIVGLSHIADSKSIYASAVLFVAMGFALGELANAIYVLGLIEDPEAMKVAAGAVGGLIVALGVMAVLLEAFAKRAKPGPIYASAVLMIAMAAAVNMLMLCMVELAAVYALTGGNIVAIIAIAAAIAGLLLELGILAIILEGISKDADPVSMAAGALVVEALGSAMLLVSAGIAIIGGLGKFSYRTLEGTLHSMEILLPELGVLAIAMVTIAKGADPLNVAAGALVIEALASAMLIVSYAAVNIGEVAKQGPDALTRTVGSVAGLIAELAILAGALVYISSKQDLKDTGAMAAAASIIQALGKAMVSVSYAVQNIGAVASLGGDTLPDTVSAVALLLGELAGLGVALTYISSKSDTGKIAASAVVVEALGSAMIFVAAAIQQIALIQAMVGDPDQFREVMVSVGLLLAELGVLSGVLAWLSGTADVADIAAAAALVLSLGGAFYIIAEALSALTALPDPEVIKQAEGAVAVLAGCAALLVAFSSFLDGTDGLEIVGMGVAVLALAAAVWVLVDAFKGIADIDTTSFTLIISWIAGLIGEFELLAIVLAALDEVSGLIGLGAIALLVAGLFAIAEAAKSFASAANAISNAINTIMMALLMLAAFSPEQIETMMTSIVSTVKATAIGVAEGLDEMLAVLAEKAPSITQNLVTVVSNLIQQLDLITTPFLEQAFNVIEQTLVSILQVVESLLLELGDWLWEEATVLMQGLGDCIVDMLDYLAQRTPDFAKAFADLVIACMEAFATEFPRIIEGAVNAAALFITGLAAGIDNNRGKLKKALGRLLKALWQTLTGGVEASEKPTKNLGKKIVNWFKDGIGATASAVFNKIGEIIDGVFEKIKSAISDAWNSGWNFATSWVQGIAEKINNSTLGKNIGEFFGSVADWARDELGVNSPSTAFKEIGTYVDEGLEEGIEEGSDDVQETVEDLADDTSESFLDSIKGLWDGEGGFGEALSSLFGGIFGDEGLSLDLSDSDSITSFLANLLGIDEDELTIDVDAVLDSSDFEDAMDSISSGSYSAGVSTSSATSNAEQTTSDYNESTSSSSDKKDKKDEDEDEKDSGTNGGITVNVYASEGQDAKEISEEVVTIVKNDVVKRRAVYET